MCRKLRGFSVVSLVSVLLGCGPVSAPPRPAVVPSPTSNTASTATVSPAAPATRTTIDGAWRGTLGGALRLVFTLTRAADGGEYKGTLESLDQNATLPISGVKLIGADAVRIDVERVGGFFEGKLDDTREKLVGAWTQKGQTTPLELARGGASEATPATSTSGARRKPLLDVPLEVTIPVAPAVVRGEDATHLVYELHVTNFSGRTVTLQKIETTNADSKARIGVLEGRELAEALLRPGTSAMEVAQRVSIGPGLRAVVYMWLDLSEAAPKALAHDIRVTLDDGKEPGTKEPSGREELALAVTRVTVGTEPAFVAGPPLRGGDWLAGNGPSRTSGHRRALLALGGHARISQRFAIDWVKVRDGKTFAGDESSNASYFCYGAEALAIADGVVAATKDGIAENAPGKTPEPVTLENIAGNHVVLDFGKGRFALYAHFKPGSLKVKVGDRVKKGQVLGLVGNSGNSTEPHLHLHVSDGASPLGSEGMPWVIDTFEAHPAKATTFKKVTRELPLEDALVRFGP